MSSASFPLVYIVDFYTGFYIRCLMLGFFYFRMLMDILCCVYIRTPVGFLISPINRWENTCVTFLLDNSNTLQEMFGYIECDDVVGQLASDQQAAGCGFDSWQRSSCSMLIKPAISTSFDWGLYIRNPTWRVAVEFNYNFCMNVICILVQMYRAHCTVL